MKTPFIKYTFIFILSLIVAGITACKSNSSDSGESYEISQFIGKWERTNSTSEEIIACPDDPLILEISQTEIRYPYADENGCAQSWQIMEYTFDGQKFSVDAGFDYKIQSHSGNQFIWKDNFDGTEETYKKVQ